MITCQDQVMLMLEGGFTGEITASKLLVMLRNLNFNSSVHNRWKKRNQCFKKASRVILRNPNLKKL